MSLTTGDPAAAAGWIEGHEAWWAFLALPLAILLALLPFFIARQQRSDRLADDAETLRHLRHAHRRIKPSSWRLPREFRDALLPWSFEGLDFDAGEADDVARRLFDEVLKGESILIEGDAGAGKSTLVELVRVASYDADAARELPLVEVVAAHAWGGSSRRSGALSLSDWAAKTLASRHPGLTRSTARRLVERGQLILAIDGVDEVRGADRAGLVEEIGRLSARVPVIITRRSAVAQQEQSAPVPEMPGLDLRRLVLRPLDEADVTRRLELHEVALPARVRPPLMVSLTNPLMLAVFLWCWDRSRARDQLLEACAREPDGVWTSYIDLAKDQMPHRELAEATLRYAGVVITASGHRRNAKFRAGVVLRDNIAARLVAWLLGSAVFCVGWWCLDARILAISLLVAFLTAGRTWWSGSFVERLFGTSRWIVATFVGVACAFAFVTVVRIAVYADYSRSMDYVWHEWRNSYFVWLAWTCYGVSWLGVVQLQPIRKRRHGLLVVGLLAVAVLGSVDLVRHERVGLEFMLGYYGLLASPAVHYCVSAARGTLATGVPPWRWGSLRENLVATGMVRRDGDEFRFLHGDLEDQVVRSLLRLPRSPRTLWLDARPGVSEAILLEQPMYELSDRTVRLLARAGRWSSVDVNALVMHLLWVRGDPRWAAQVLRRHALRVPRSTARVMEAEVLLRCGRPGPAVSSARRWVQRGLRDQTAYSEYFVNWSTRALARSNNAQIVTAVARRHGELTEQPTYIRFCVLRAARDARELDDEQYRTGLELLEEAGEQSAARALSLEDLRDGEAARALTRLEALDPDPWTRARTAQALARLGRREAAEEFAAAGLFHLSAADGYEGILECLVTAGALGLIEPRSAFAAHLDTLIASGYTLRHSGPVTESLGIQRGDPLARVCPSYAAGADVRSEANPRG